MPKVHELPLLGDPPVGEEDLAQWNQGFHQAVYEELLGLRQLVNGQLDDVNVSVTHPTPDPSTEVSKNNATAVGTRRTLNFIEGANVGLSVDDDEAGDEIDVTIKSSVEVSKNNASAVGARKTLNFIEGSGVTITVVDDESGDEIDITIAAAGGSDTAHDVQFSTVSDDLTATGTTDIVNVTEAGRLISIAVLVTTGLTNTLLDSVLEIVIDGGSTRTIKTWVPGVTPWPFDGISIYAIDNGLVGAAALNRAIIVVGANYATSLRVSHNISTGTDAGVVQFSVLRGKAL